MARSPLTRAEASRLGAVDEASEAAREVEEQRQATEQERRLARRRKVIEQAQGEGLLLVLGDRRDRDVGGSPYFMTTANLLTAASVVSILGIMAVLETLVIIAGEIDISIGSVMAATSVILGLLVTLA